MRVGTHEGVLSDLCGALRLADHHQYQTEEPAFVPLQETPERLTIAAPDVADGVAVRDTHAPGSASSTSPSPIDA